MKKLEIPARRAKSLITLGAVRVHTKGSADVGQDGTQSQPKTFIGLD